VITDPEYDPAAMTIHRRKVDAVTLLSVYLLLLLVIPQRLVLAPVGAAGGPSTIFAGLLFCVFLVAWLHPAFTLDHGRQPIRSAAALFTCVVLAAYVSANRHAMPTLELNGADRGVIFALGWLGVLLLAADGIDSMDRLKTLIRRIVMWVTAMAALGVTQFFTGLDAAKYIKIPGLTSIVPYSDLAGERGGLNRPSATALHPIEFGALLAMTLALAVHQARYAPPELRVRRWLQVGLISLALPMTVSRSAILGLIIVLIVILPSWRKQDRRLAYVVIVIGTLGMWVTIHGLAGTLRNLFLNFSSDSSTTSRTGAFSSAAAYISQHPWFGRGLGTFLPQTYFFTDDQYLGALIEIGVMGLLALLTLFATGWFVARSARRATIDPESRDLAQSLAASIAVAAVVYATFDALSFFMAAGLTFLLLGCTGAVCRLIRADEGTLSPAAGASRKRVAQPSALIRSLR
jgi:O-antigen ligase